MPTEAQSGRELWTSDGTTAGTVQVKNLRVGGSSNPTGLTRAGGALYFTANAGDAGRELWTSDGTGAGTVVVTDLRIGSCHNVFPGLTAFPGGLVYLADDGSHGCEPWLVRTDGP